MRPGRDIANSIIPNTSPPVPLPGSSVAREGELVDTREFNLGGTPLPTARIRWLGEGPGVGQPMPDPNAYPADYRAREIEQLVRATRAGECAAVIGLSGAGKSNVLRRFVEVRAEPPVVMVDANRLAAPSAAGLFELTLRALGESEAGREPFAALEAVLEGRLHAPESSLTLAFDRFDAVAGEGALFGPLRSLRDAHKYRLTFVIAARRPLDARNELAELFFGNILWLGPLSDSDARWTVNRYTARKGLSWEERTARKLIELTRGYPSLLRAACEAHAAGCALTAEAMTAHPAVRARLDEFWADAPTEDELQKCGLANLPLLMAARPGAKVVTPQFDTSRLTAKENTLLQYFLAHPNAVCEKDAIIRTVWAEDKVFAQGVRDDSLAQLIRRLREKIEPDPANPRHIHTVPGRGYRFTG